MEKVSKMSNNFFDEFSFSDDSERVDNLHYTGSKFVPKSAFVASDDPQWWNDVADKVHEMIVHLESNNSMDYFAKALEELSYLTANHVDVDYELLKYFKVPDIGYYLDYLQTMEQSAAEQDPEGFINAFDGLVDYIDSMTPKESRKAQEMSEEQVGDIDWDGIVSSVTELLALSRRRNIQYFMQELDYLNALVLDHVSMPDDLTSDEIF